MTRRPMRPNPLMPTRIFSPLAAGRTSDRALTTGSLDARVTVETRAVHLSMNVWGVFVFRAGQRPGFHGREGARRRVGVPSVVSWTRASPRCRKISFPAGAQSAHAATGVASSRGESRRAKSPGRSRLTTRTRRSRRFRERSARRSRREPDRGRGARTLFAVLFRGLISGLFPSGGTHLTVLAERTRLPARTGRAVSAAVVAADMVFCSGWVRGRSAVCQRLARPAGSARRKAGKKISQKGIGVQKKGPVVTRST